MRNALLAAALPWLVGLGSACLQIPAGPSQECAADADCDTALGEACSDGVCYGGPPAGTFAAVVTPPSDRSDLITVELPHFTLPADGDLSTLVLATPARIGGRVEAYCGLPQSCEGTSIAATIVISRAPLFPGGTGFSTVVTSKDGLPRGSNSFSVTVPRSTSGDPPYVLSIVPSGNGALPPANGATSAAEQAAPMLLQLAALSDIDTGTLVLGSAQSQVITGSLTDGASHLLQKYRVVARGRLVAGGPVTEVSTVYYTANGQYTITLSDGAIGPISVNATPYDANVVAPTLSLGGLEPRAAVRFIAQPANTGNKVLLTIPIEGLSTGGAVAPVAGAHVIVAARFSPMINGTSSATLSVETTTGADGMAHLTLLDGPAFAGLYKLRVIPPTGSLLGTIYDQPLALDAVSAVRLPPRVALRGRVLDGGGEAVGKLSVTALASVHFSWTEPEDAAAFLAGIPAPTALTSDDGSYVIYVDPYVAGVWGHYDLEFDAPSGVSSASWVVADVEIPREANLATVTLPDATVPDSAYFRANLADPGHLRVGGGELRIFSIASDSSLCDRVPYPPANCVIPAQLLGHAASNETGALKLALPRQLPP
ncbi:hypothetical protein BH11MYX1_BH11MYX1_25550 [soil metagenome]